MPAAARSKLCSSVSVWHSAKTITDADYADDIYIYIYSMQKELDSYLINFVARFNDILLFVGNLKQKSFISEYSTWI